MSDLIERARRQASFIPARAFRANPADIDKDMALIFELADEIEQLRTERARMLAALEAMHEEFASSFPDGENTAVDMARSALVAKGKDAP